MSAPPPPRELSRRDPAPRVGDVDLRARAGASGADAAPGASAIVAALEANGCVRLLHVLEPGQVAALHAHLEQNAAENGRAPARAADRREPGRRRVLPPFAGPLRDTALHAQPDVQAAARRLLGDDCVIGELSALQVEAGAGAGAARRGAESLFGDAAIDATTPPAAMLLLAPVADVGAGGQALRVWPGSHRAASLEAVCAEAAVEVRLPPGAVLLVDPRTAVADVANPAATRRWLLRLGYHRHWYRPWQDFEEGPPLRVAWRVYRSLPAAQRALFAWRFDRYARQRPVRVARRLLSRLPSAWLARLLALWRRVRS